MLSRREEETILIKPDIVIQVLEIRGNKVRLGIEAPLSVRILRGEIYLERKSSTQFELDFDLENFDFGEEGDDSVFTN